MLVTAVAVATEGAGVEGDAGTALCIVIQEETVGESRRLLPPLGVTDTELGTAANQAKRQY